MEVLVQPLNLVLHVKPGTNLLEALRSAQVPVSHSCMSGRCGTCRCRVVEGEVLEGVAEQRRPLDGGDEADTSVLACQTYVTGPCVIRIQEPDEVVVHPAQSVAARVVDLQPLARDLRRLRLRPARPIEFSPGQYAQLQFQRGLSRPYSMVGLPGDELLEFHIRLLPGGRASEHIAGALKPGASIKLSGPLGASYLRRRHDGPMLCVAGGTGLAPMLSIIRGAVAAGLRNPIHLYIAARTPDEVYGLEALQALRDRHPTLTVHTVVAAGSPAPGQRRGLVTQALQDDLPSLAGWRAYLAGSPPVVEATALLTRRLGLAPECLYADAFYAHGA